MAENYEAINAINLSNQSKNEKLREIWKTPGVSPAIDAIRENKLTPEERRRRKNAKRREKRAKDREQNAPLR